MLTLVMVPETVTVGTPASVSTAVPPPADGPSSTSGVSSLIEIRASAGAGLGM